MTGGLVIAIVAGAPPLDEILEVDTTTDGSHSRPVPNRPHLRLATGAGEVVIDVRDGAVWADAVRAQMPTAAGRDES